MFGVPQDKNDVGERDGGVFLLSRGDHKRRQTEVLPLFFWFSVFIFDKFLFWCCFAAFQLTVQGQTGQWCGLPWQCRAGLGKETRDYAMKTDVCPFCKGVRGGCHRRW